VDVLVRDARLVDGRVVGLGIADGFYVEVTEHARALATYRTRSVIRLADLARAAGLASCHERVVDVLREHARPRWVLRAGRVVAESEEQSRIHR
jgi:hypothetical protein